VTIATDATSADTASTIVARDATGSVGVTNVNLSSGINFGTYSVGTNPNGIAVDQSGNVWVVNAGSNNVTKLSSAGDTLGTYSVGTSPQYVAVDQSGNVWVVNNGSNNVTKLSSAGATLGTYSVGSGPQYDVAVDQSGNVWVVNAGSNNVTKLSSAGATLGTYSVGTNPVGVAVDQSGNVWVVNDGSNNVTKLSSAGATLGTYSGGTNPVGVAVDQSGNVWVVSNSSDNVTKLSSAGATLGTYSVATNPVGVAVDQFGNVWVANAGSANVTKLSSGSNGVLVPLVQNLPQASGPAAISGMTTGQLPVAASATTVTSSIAYATANTASTVVERDGSGNFSAGTITAALNGTAANLSGTPALPNGTTATTQTVGDNTTKIATDAFVLANGSSYTLPTATSTVLGGVKPDGTTISNAAGVIAVASPYNPASVAITGGTINGTPLGVTTPAAIAATTLSATGSFTLAPELAPVTCTTATTLGLDNSPIIQLTNADTCAITFTQPSPAAMLPITVKIIQSATTPYSGQISGVGVTWVGGSAPVIPSTASAVVTIYCRLNGTTTTCVGPPAGAAYPVANTTFTTSTSSVAANTCNSTVQVAMTGVTTAMTFTISASADTASAAGWGSTGGLILDPWPTSGYLNYKICNQTPATISTPGAVTFNVGAR
jgi:streptogramin lyase